MKKYRSYAVVLCIIIIVCHVQVAPGQEYRRTKREFTVPEGKTLEVVIIGDIGNLFIDKSRSGNSGNLDVRYDAELFNFDYFYDEEYTELYVALEKDDFFEGIHDTDTNEKTSEITVNLPQKRDINLEVSVKAGVINLDLGGIPLRNFSVDSWASETTIRFDEPNPKQLGYLKVDVNIGEVLIEKLGNANFRDAIIDGGIGEVTVDLNGEYSKGEHSVTVDMEIGEVEIIPPRNVEYRITVSKWPLVSHVNMKRGLYKKGRYYYSRNYDDAETTLTIKVDMGIGECTIR